MHCVPRTSMVQVRLKHQLGDIGIRAVLLFACYSLAMQCPTPLTKAAMLLSTALSVRQTWTSTLCSKSMWDPPILKGLCPDLQIGDFSCTCHAMRQDMVTPDSKHVSVPHVLPQGMISTSGVNCSQGRTEPFQESACMRRQKAAKHL